MAEGKSIDESFLDAFHKSQESMLPDIISSATKIVETFSSQAEGQAFKKTSAQIHKFAEAEKRKRPVWLKFFFFLSDSLHHSFILILGAAFLMLIFALAHYIFPDVMTFLNHELENILTIIRPSKVGVGH